MYWNIHIKKIETVSQYICSFYSDEIPLDDSTKDFDIEKHNQLRLSDERLSDFSFAFLHGLAQNS